MPIPAAPRTPQAEPGNRELPFWQRAGAVWRQLAGRFSRDGFSFDWHELRPSDDQLVTLLR